MPPAGECCSGFNLHPCSRVRLSDIIEDLNTRLPTPEEKHCVEDGRRKYPRSPGGAGSPRSNPSNQTDFRSITVVLTEIDNLPILAFWSRLGQLNSAQSRHSPSFSPKAKFCPDTLLALTSARVDLSLLTSLAPLQFSNGSAGWPVTAFGLPGSNPCYHRRRRLPLITMETRPLTAHLLPQV